MSRLKRRRMHPHPWLSSHKLGRPVGLAKPCGLATTPMTNIEEAAQDRSHTAKTLF